MLVASYWNVMTWQPGSFSGRRSFSHMVLVPTLGVWVHDLMQSPSMPWTATTLLFRVSAVIVWLEINMAAHSMTVLDSWVFGRCKVRKKVVSRSASRCSGFPGWFPMMGGNGRHVELVLRQLRHRETQRVWAREETGEAFGFRLQLLLVS